MLGVVQYFRKCNYNLSLHLKRSYLHQFQELITQILNNTVAIAIDPPHHRCCGNHYLSIDQVVQHSELRQHELGHQKEIAQLHATIRGDKQINPFSKMNVDPSNSEKQPDSAKLNNDLREWINLSIGAKILAPPQARLLFRGSFAVLNLTPFLLPHYSCTQPSIPEEHR